MARMITREKNIFKKYNINEMAADEIKPRIVFSPPRTSEILYAILTVLTDDKYVFGSKYGSNETNNTRRNNKL